MDFLPTETRNARNVILFKTVFYHTDLSRGVHVSALSPVYSSKIVQIIFLL